MPKNENLFSYQDETELINLAKTDPKAFGQLYERYVERIYSYIYFRVGSINDSEDLTAKVFFKALNSIHRYNHMGLPLSAWLYRIAHNQVANHFRDRSKVKEIPISDLPYPDLTFSGQAPETNALRQQEIRFLQTVINDLPKIKRELIILKFVHKLSNAEIAFYLHRSESAIKSLYHRTLLEIRERLKQDSGEQFQTIAGEDEGER